MATVTVDVEVHSFITRGGKMYELNGTYPTAEQARRHAKELEHGVVRTMVKRVEGNCFAVYKTNAVGDNRYKKL